jgi:hypothetical protein
VIRFMDWPPANTTNQTTWATRKPVDYVFYSGAEYRLSMWAGETTNVGDAYTAPLTPSGWVGLVDKATVIVKFNASASGDSATLTVAGTTKTIRNSYGDATSSGGNTRPSAGRFGTLVYDSTLDAWLKYGGDVAAGDQGLGNGVPPEVMLTVATRLGVHLYVTTPYLASDPLTDYIPSLAAYLRDSAPSWMIPRFEGPNETWNSSSGFFATRYAWNKAFAYWGVTTDHNNWFGKTVSLAGQAVSSAYSNNRARYQVLAGVWTGSGCGNESCSTSATSGSNTRLNSALWISSGPSQSGYSNAAGVGEAYRWVTHVAMANYVTPTAYGTLQELRDGYAYVVTNAGNPSAQTTLADAYADTLGGASAPYNLNYVKAVAGHWYAWAQGNWGGSINLPLTAYEGGYSPDYIGTIWTSPVTGVTAANPSVITMPTTANSRSSQIVGNPAVAGMSLTIPLTITNVTQASSAVVTVSGFNMATVGKSLIVSGFSVAGGTGMTQLNGTRTITNVSGQDITLNVDSTAFTPYVSGGTGTLTAAVASVSGLDITTDIDGSSFGAYPSAAATFTIASPGEINWTGHGRSVNERIFCKSTGTLPTMSSGTMATTPLFVKTVLDANRFTVALSAGGTVLNFSGTPTGTATCSTAPWTASYVNSALYTNTLRWASKFSTHLQTQMTQHYTDMAAVPLVFPSHFVFSGSSVNADNRVSGGVIGAGQVWGLYDQGLYATPYSPAVESIRQFNLN